MLIKEIKFIDKEELLVELSEDLFNFNAYTPNVTYHVNSKFWNPL